jgi:hypothetical protein
MDRSSDFSYDDLAHSGSAAASDTSTPTLCLQCMLIRALPPRDRLCPTCGVPLRRVTAAQAELFQRTVAQTESASESSSNMTPVTGLGALLPLWFSLMSIGASPANATASPDGTAAPVAAVPEAAAGTGGMDAGLLAALAESLNFAEAAAHRPAAPRAVVSHCAGSVLCVHCDVLVCSRSCGGSCLGRMLTQAATCPHNAALALASRCLAPGKAIPA